MNISRPCASNQTPWLEILVTSTFEVLSPSGSEFIVVRLDYLLDLADLVAR